MEWVPLPPPVPRHGRCTAGPGLEAAARPHLSYRDCPGTAGNLHMWGGAVSTVCLHVCFRARSRVAPF